MSARGVGPNMGIEGCHNILRLARGSLAPIVANRGVAASSDF